MVLPNSLPRGLGDGFRWTIKLMLDFLRTRSSVYTNELKFVLDTASFNTDLRAVPEWGRGDAKSYTVNLPNMPGTFQVDIVHLWYRRPGLGIKIHPLQPTPERVIWDEEAIRAVTRMAFELYMMYMVDTSVLHEDGVFPAIWFR